MTRISLALGTALALLPLSAQADGPLNIVATTGMVGDAAAQVGGEFVEVQSLMGPGVDPHAYRQTRSDIVATARADVVFWHGLYLEAQMEEFLVELGETTTVVPVAEALPQENLLQSDDYAERFDPHIWMDPTLWVGAVQEITATLSTVMPDAADTFAANAAAHIAELEQLDAYADRVLATIPDTARVLITAHDAFNYFGAAYNFEVVGIQGISTESEAGLQRIGELVDMLVERDVRAVFVESSVSDRNIRALIEGAAAQGHEVVIGGELFSDAMGEAGTYEGTLIGMLDHNITTIAGALGGTVPDGGMQGALALN